jgi:hypothetical protein
MAETTIRLDWRDEELLRTLAGIPARVNRAAEAALKYHAPRALAYARQNAPWTDRTANARNGLFTTVRKDGATGYVMTLGHSVPYGIWLEVRFSGRFAIIRPTIAHEAPEVFETFRQLVKAELGMN